MEDTKIIIDLSKTDTQAFGDTNFIQVEAREKLFKLIENFKNDIKDSKEIKRAHHTILVQGKRGMGKTSFILSVVQKLKEKHSDICSLEIIDPTLIESKEHIMLNIITRIKEKVINLKRKKRKVK